MTIFSDNLQRSPTEVDKQISHLKALREEAYKVQDARLNGTIDLFNEKFVNVQTQFKERDVRVEQTAKDTKVAVDAALQAAEKAVGKQNDSFTMSINKSEASTVKLLDQLGENLRTSNSTMDGKVNDLKERVSRIESTGVGVKNARDDSAVKMTLIIGIASVIAISTGAYFSRPTGQTNVVPVAPMVTTTPQVYIPAPTGTLLPSNATPDTGKQR